MPQEFGPGFTVPGMYNRAKMSSPYQDPTSLESLSLAQRNAPGFNALAAALDPEQNYKQIQDYLNAPGTPAWQKLPGNLVTLPMAGAALIENTVKTGGKLVAQSPVGEVAKNVARTAPAFFSGATNEELKQLSGQGKVSETPAAPDDSDARNKAAQADIVNGLFGGTPGAEMQKYDLGPKEIFGAPRIPLPPPGTSPDYSKVRDLVYQMRPEAVDEQAMDNTKGMAVLAGMAAGLLGGTSDDIGQTLLQMGVGALSGVASVDEAKKVAKEKFKESMNEYLRTSIGVEKAAADSQADYANRVWETQVQQAKLNYEAGRANAEAREGKLMQVGDQIYNVSVQNGRRVLQPLTEGKNGRFSGMINTLQGLGLDEKEAKATAAQAMFGGDGAMALPRITVAMLNHNGATDSVLSLIGSAGAEGKDFVKKYTMAGSSIAGMPNMKTEEVQAQVQAQREAMLSEMLYSSPALLQASMRKAGMPSIMLDVYQQKLGAK